jgi:ferric-dicitrate binding protein FerR (iron transport regulator)
MVTGVTVQTPPSDSPRIDGFRSSTHPTTRCFLVGWVERSETHRRAWGRRLGESAILDTMTDDCFHSKIARTGSPSMKNLTFALGALALVGAALFILLPGAGLLAAWTDTVTGVHGNEQTALPVAR